MFFLSKNKGSCPFLCLKGLYAPGLCHLPFFENVGKIGAKMVSKQVNPQNLTAEGNIIMHLDDFTIYVCVFIIYCKKSEEE